MATYGYHSGPTTTVEMPAANTAAIAEGDLVKRDGVAGYITPCGAGELPIGVAKEMCAVPTDDGDYTFMVYTSSDTRFVYPPDTGSVTVGLNGLKMDVGGAQAIDIDASTDGVVFVDKARVNENQLIVHFDFNAGYAGV